MKYWGLPSVSWNRIPRCFFAAMSMLWSELGPICGSIKMFEANKLRRNGLAAVESLKLGNDGEELKSF